MSPSPIRFVFLFSITVNLACTVEEVGLGAGVPSVQPAGGEEPIVVDAASPGRADASGERDVAAPLDSAFALDGDLADGPESPADTSLPTALEVAPPPPDVDSPAPPDAADPAPPDTAAAPHTVPPAPPDAASPPPVDEPAGACPQRPELAVCFAFEGTVRDESPHQLSPMSGNTSFQPGPTGQAVHVGEGAFVLVPPNPLFDSAAVTLEVWIQPRALGRRMGVLSNGNPYGLVILPSGSAMCTGGGGYALAGGAVTPGRWTSLACTYDAEVVALWIDGRKAAENMRTGPLRTGSPTGLAVGNELPEGNLFDGLVDNVRIWREVRSARQICAGARDCAPGP